MPSRAYFTISQTVYEVYEYFGVDMALADWCHRPYTLSHSFQSCHIPVKGWYSEVCLPSQSIDPNPHLKEGLRLKTLKLFRLLQNHWEKHWESVLPHHLTLHLLQLIGRLQITKRRLPPMAQ